MAIQETDKWKTNQREDDRIRSNWCLSLKELKFVINKKDHPFEWLSRI